MANTGVPYTIRPLGFGELIEQTFNVYSRNFLTFLSIALVVVIPPVIANIFLLPKFSALSLTRSGSPAITQDFWNAMGLTFLVLVGVALVVTCLRPFVLVASASGVQEAYTNGKPAFAGSYVKALRRWPSLLGLVLFEFLIFAGLIVAVSVFSTLITSPFATGGRNAIGGAFWASFIVATSIAAAAIGLCGLAIAVAFNTAGLEKRSAAEALGSGFVRVLNRTQFWRALGVMLLAAVILLGFPLLLAFLIRGNLIASAAMGAVVGLIAESFVAVLLAIYYFDVRLRRDGTDLWMDFQSLSADASQATPGVGMLSNAERSLIASAASRKRELDRNVYAALAQKLAERVRPRVSRDLQGLSDEQLLEAVT